MQLISAPKRLTAFELFFLICGAVLTVGFVGFGDTFAKLGFPLPFKSSIPNLRSKLFVFEIYLGLMGVWFLATPSSFSRLKLALQKDLLTQIAALLLIFALLRMIPDFMNNPLLSMRNAAFAWYLSLPLMIVALPIRISVLEFFARMIVLLAFAYFSATVLMTYSRHNFNVNWLPDVGVCAVLSLAVITRSLGRAWPVLMLVGLALGVNYWEKYQRTALVGIVFTVALLFYSLPERRVRILNRLGLLLLFFSIGLLTWQPLGARNIVTHQKSWWIPQQSEHWSLSTGLGVIAKSQPLQKAQLNEYGLEVFRSSMWMDAFNLFLSRPLVGIGFQKQVVHRIFSGGTIYHPNDGSWALIPQPPISGPHNSYLNAIARLGILGALFMVMHLLAGRRLWLNECYGCFFLLVSGVIYAFFNVGLEGPIHSFLLLTMIGAAFKVHAEANLPLSEKNPQTSAASGASLRVGERNTLPT